MQSKIDTQNVKDWYDARYRSGHEQSFGRPPYESELRLHYLPAKEQLRILDVGAGQGYFLLAAHNEGHQAIGIDISLESANIAAQVSPQTPVYVANGQNLPFENNTFDVVAFWGTLEHHPDMQQTLKECHRVVKQDGRVILRVPNRLFWVYQIWELLGLQTGTEQSELIEHMLSLDEWTALFNQAKLEVLSTDVDDWFVQQPFNTAKGLRKKATLALRKFAIAAAPLTRTYTFDFVCKPLP
jgi:ubiquinone/menaquinone biosynthesis C-methylase UbiE